MNCCTKHCPRQATQSVDFGIGQPVPLCNLCLLEAAEQHCIKIVEDLPDTATDAAAAPTVSSKGRSLVSLVSCVMFVAVAAVMLYAAHRAGGIVAMVLVTIFAAFMVGRAEADPAQ